MSSRDIAELLRRTPDDAPREDNVERTIERLAARGLVTFTPAEEQSTGGRPATVYHVNQRDPCVIVAQLSPEFTTRLVDRWQELEAQVAKPAPVLDLNSVSGLRALALGYPLTG